MRRANYWQRSVRCSPILASSWQTPILRRVLVWHSNASTIFSIVWRGKDWFGSAKSFDGYSAAITGEPDPTRPGFGEYRLKDRGVPIWAIIGSLTEDADNIDEVAEAYDVPREAVEAALAFYRRHRAAIDVRLAQNVAS